MKLFLRSGLALAVIASATYHPASASSRWVQVGRNKYGIAAAWARPSTYKSLNADSFRVEVQVTAANNRKITGKLDVNCRNRDYYFRPKGVLSRAGSWAVIEKGSPVESVGILFCRKTSSASRWGYTKDTKALWGGPLPSSSPDLANGEWIKTHDDPTLKAFYNDDVIKDIDGNFITFAYYFRTNKGDMRDENKDKAEYAWLRASCSKNISSAFVETDNSGNGVWEPPKPGAPDGVTMIVRKQFC